MEHILQFAISIDEDKIVEIAQNKAAKQIEEKIQKEIDKYTRGYMNRLDMIFKEEVKKAVEGRRDEIVEIAIKNFCNSLPKTKRVKEILSRLETIEEALRGDD